jgi:hypothetical protein
MRLQRTTRYIFCCFLNVPDFHRIAFVKVGNGA